MNVTIYISLKLISVILELQLVFLCIDDVMVSKFENVSKIFIYVAYNAFVNLSKYCFVKFILGALVKNNYKVIFQAISP